MIHPLRSLPRFRLVTPALLAAVSLFLMIGSCGGNDDPYGDGGGGGGTFNGTISLSGSTFSPKHATINAGESVTWVWNGGTHTVTHGTDPNLPETRLFDDGPKSSGSFTYTFNTPGTYPYFCRQHYSMNMKGTVTVEQ